MFKTKRDIDRHVTHILTRIRDAKERSSRGLQFAKLYYDVSDYESAKRYLQTYLNAHETSPQAHKLMGQILEAKKDKKQALKAYQRCLELDPEQKELVLKVCELYSDASVEVNADVANLWTERAERYYPNNNIIFRLKEKVLYSNATDDIQDLEHLINEELVKNPAEVQLHIRLLRMYIHSRQLKRAYKHVIETESTLAFTSSVEWYSAVLDVFQMYQDQYGGTDNDMFFTHKLFTMAMLALLQLQSEDHDIHSAVKILHTLDQDLYLANRIHRDAKEWNRFLTEMNGQLFYLLALLLLKKALNGLMSWKDASCYGAVCFLLSNSVVPIDLYSSWYCQAIQDRKRFYDHLYKAGCDRLSQGGHMIYSFLSKEEGNKQWARKLRQKLCTAQGKGRLYTVIFTEELYHRKDSSYFMQSDIFTETNLEVPAKSLLKKYDAVAYSLHRKDLNHLVWLAMQYHVINDDIQPNYEQIFGCQLYPNMKYSIPDLSGGDPSTLCQLDVQVFLYASVRWAIIKDREQKRNICTIPDKPDLLPKYLSVPYCNAQQTEWWSAVFCMEMKEASEKRAKLWRLVMHGLETIRLVVPDALSLQLVVHIAVTLDARAKDMQSLGVEGIVTPKLSAILNRATFYWKTAAEMIDRVERNQIIRMPKEMIFPSNHLTDPVLIKKLKDQVKFAMATVAMRNHNYEEALSKFADLSCPEAAYNSGLIYRKMVEEVCDSNHNSSSSVDFDKQMAMLTNSKSALCKALEILEIDRNEELKQAVKKDLDDVLSKLLSLEPRYEQTDDILSPGIDPRMTTPSEVREKPRTSPTCDDVQCKAKEAAYLSLLSEISTHEESMRTNEKTIQEIFSQLREYRDENRLLHDQIQTLSVQGLSGVTIRREQGIPLPAARDDTMTMPFDILTNVLGETSILNGTRGTPPVSQQPLPAQLPGPGYFSWSGQVAQPGSIQTPHRMQEMQNTQKILIKGSSFTSTPKCEPSSLGTVNTTKSGVMFIPQTTGSVFGTPSAAVNGTGSSIFMFGTPSASVSGTARSDFRFGTPPTTVSGIAGSSVKFGSPSTTCASSISSDHKTSCAKVTPCSQAGLGFVFNVPSASETEVNDRATIKDIGEGTTLQNQDASKKPPSDSSEIQNNVQETQSWECHACNTSSDETEVRCHKCGTASLADDVPDSFLSVPTTADPKPSIESKSSSAGFKFVPRFGKPLFSLGTASQPESCDLQPDELPTSFPLKKFQGKDHNKKLHASRISTLLKATDGFKFTFAPTTDSKIPQPVATLGSGFHFSICMTPLIKSSMESPSKLHSVTSCNNSSVKPPDESDNSYYEYNQGVKCNVHFEPVIELPSRVEVKTGEEDEEVLFCHRAKLYRFLNGEWKERGVGVVRVLYHNESKRSRIVMRIEHILKLCCNHYIVPELNVKPMPNTKGCALVWSALDYVGVKPNTEHFSIKFKTEENAKMFASAIDEAKAKSKGEISLKSSKVETIGTISVINKESGKEVQNAVPYLKTMAEVSESDVMIVKVETTKDNEVAKARKLMLPDNFDLYTKKPPCPGCQGREGSEHICQTNKEDEDYENDNGDKNDDNNVYNDDSNVDHDKKDVNEDDDYNCDETGDNNDDYSDDNNDRQQKTEYYHDDYMDNLDRGSSKMAMRSWMGRQVFGGRHVQVDESDQNYNYIPIQHGNDRHFGPVAPLPNLIEVVNGEEDETVEFCHRSKLFRFDKDSKQWKEKGVGDMKILKHNNTGVYRLLFRRENVHKLSCNHRLTADIHMQPLVASEMSWCWTAPDFSENELKVEILAVKFKNIELSKSFRDKIDKIQEELRKHD